MAANNRTPENSCEILVRVSGNVLQFDENVWQKFNEKHANNPLIVLSVVGQPKSRKTSLMNHVLALLSEDGIIAPQHLLPLSSNSEIPWSNGKILEEGILACAIECQIEFELFTFLLLDIWSPSEVPRVATYNKLVDFCLAMSSAVIFSESWEQENPVIYWRPELSILSQLDCSPIRNSQQLHFLIHTDEYDESPRLYLFGCPLKYHCSELLMARFQTASGTYSFLQSRCDYVTSSFISTDEMALTALEGEDSVLRIAIIKILLNCADNPVRINATQIGIWFGKCVEIINGSPSKFVSTITIDNEFNSDIEMKDLSRGAKEDDPDKANEANFAENDSNAVDFEAITVSSVSSLPELCLDYNDIIEHSLSEYDWECKDFQKEEENILKEVLSKNVTQSDWQKSQLEEQTMMLLRVLAEMLESYNRYFTKQLQEKLCVEEIEFDKIHEESLTHAEKAVRMDNFPRQKLSEIFVKISAKQKLKFRKSNSLMYEEEKRISHEAYQFAVMKFKSLTEGKLSTNTFSEHEFQTAYQRMCTVTCELFLQALERPHTTPWIREHQHLVETLASLQTSYMQQNTDHLMKVDLTRKEAIRAGKQCYEDEMTNTLPGTKLSKEKLESVSQACCDVAMRKFHQKIGRNISKNISVKWEDEMKTALNELKLLFVAKNYNLLAPPEPTFQLQPVGHLGIGLYIDQQSVFISIDRRNPSESSCFEHDHNIAIVDREILFGENASSVDKNQRKCLWYNTAFGLLTYADSYRWFVNIDGKAVTVGQEEILALYFHELRMRIECIVKHRVSSCFVAITGLLTSGAKQILKSSLTLAGFANNTLISSTTAMAVSYSQLLRSQKTHPNLFLYTSSNLVEVAVADVSSDQITVKNVCGKYLFGSHWENELESILRDHLRTLPCKNVIFCCDKKSVDRIHYMLNHINHVSVAVGKKDIIRVTALLDLVQNGYSAVPPIPVYNCVHPYKITVKLKGQQHRLSDFNNNHDQQLLLNRCGDVQIIEIIEEAKDTHYKWVVGSYNVIYKHEKVHKTEIRISLEKEGNLFIELNAEGHMEKSSLRSMTSIGRHDLFAFMTPIIKGRTYERVLEPLSNSNADTQGSTPSSSNTIDPAILEDLKNNLAILIATTKEELGNSKSTHSAHRDNIESKIKKCEALLTSSQIKVKQLEIEKNNLERAAKFIK